MFCCLCRYYAAFPSLSDKCDLLAGTHCLSSVEPAWARVAQTHSKVADDAKVVALDSGGSMTNNSSADSGGHSFCGGSTSGSLPANSRRHRKPRGLDGRRRNPGSRRARAGWGSMEGNLWPATMFGLPWLCSGHDGHMSYWPLQPSCAGFSRSSVMVNSDWSLPESYKDRFSDLARGQWTKPSFEEETENIVEMSVGLRNRSSQDSTDIHDVEHSTKTSSPHCRNMCGLGNVSRVVDGLGLVDGEVINSDSSIVNYTTEPAKNQSLAAVKNEELVVADRLQDDLGNLVSPCDVSLSVLPAGGFGAVLDADPHLTGINITLDDDPFLGCRPFDPALWTVLNSARMWWSNPSLSTELHLASRSSQHGDSCDISTHSAEVDSSSYSWSDVESVIDCSGCFDVNDSFSLIALQDDRRNDAETPPSNDDLVVGKLPAVNSIDRLTCTEILGNEEIWDGSRIAEAMLENDAVVMVLDAEALRQIWQPASCSSIEKLSLSSCEEDLRSDNIICRQHSQPHTTEADISATLVEDVYRHCRSNFSDWTNKCHCVSCIWQCEVLSGNVCQSPSGTTHVAKHELNPPTDECNVEQTVLPLQSSASESSIFWNEIHRDGGSTVKACSTWDSQLFSSDCLEPSSLDHTSISDEPKNNEHAVDVKVMTISDESSDDLFVHKTCRWFSFSPCNEDEENGRVPSDVTEKHALSDHLEHNDSGLDPDDNEEDQQQTEDSVSATDVAGRITEGSTEASDTRKLFNPAAIQVELCKSADDVTTALTASALSSGPDVCSTCRPVSSVLADLLEENNNISSGFSEAADAASCDDCEEIAQLLPSLASVSDIIFSDTEDSELTSSDASVFSSPEPCGDELVASESDPRSGSLTVFGSTFDNLFHLELESDLCSTAECYAGPFLAPIYTLDGSSLWFRDSCNISANVDALSRLRSDLPPSTDRLPSSSVSHESVCTAVAQCSRLLPSENTAFCDNIPQRLEPLVNLQPVPNAHAPLIASNIVRQSSQCAVSPWLWPSSVDESLSLKVMASHQHFRPIGTPSTTDSDLSEISPAGDVATSVADSLTDFTALMVSNVLADSHETYQRFVVSNEYETEGSGEGRIGGTCQTFQPSFKVRYELEKAAQTGEPTPPVSVAADVDLQLGCLVKQVLSQLSGEFPEASSNVDDILCDSDDIANDVGCPVEQNVDEASVTMSRQLSVIWNDAAAAGGTGLDSCPTASSDLLVPSCQVSHIWTDTATSVINTTSPSFVATHCRQLSDIWSNTTAQLADSAYISDSAELLPSSVSSIWKDAGQQTQTKPSRLQRMWRSVDSDDTLAVSNSGLFKPQSIWSHSRPSSVTVEVETLRPVMEDADLLSCECGRTSTSTEEHSDQCSVSPSELDIFWDTTFDQKSLTTDACAEMSIFHGGGLRDTLLVTDNIWSNDETDVESDVKALWNVHPLYCSGTETSSLPVISGNTVDPDSVADPPPFWISSKTNLDADVAYAFTHLVSGVVSVCHFVFSPGFLLL